MNEHISIWLFISVFVVLCWVPIHLVRQAKQTKLFNQLALHVLHNRVSPSESRPLYRGLRSRRNGAKLVELIRHLQIIGESLHIAFKSKKRDSAEARFTLALEHWEKVDSKYRGLLTKETYEEIEAYVIGKSQKFHSVLFLNLVETSLEKSRQLKTKKARLKHLHIAKELLEEAQASPRVDSRSLQPQEDLWKSMMKKERCDF